MGHALEIELPDNLKLNKRTRSKLHHGITKLIDDLIAQQERREAKTKTKHRFGELVIPENTRVSGWGPLFSNLEELPDDWE